MRYLTDPHIYGSETPGYRFFVELASNKLDHEGVPEYFQVIDVVVTEASYEAIKSLVATTGWLVDWGIVSYWTPATDDAPF